MAQTKSDRGLMEAALAGYRYKRDEVDRKIAELKRRIGSRPLVSELSTEEMAAAPRRRSLTRAARKRIAEAQMKRWAAFRKAKAEAQSPPTPRKAASKKPARPSAPKAAPLSEAAPTIVAAVAPPDGAGPSELLQQ